MRLTQRMNDGCDTICENCPMKGKCSDSQDCVNVLADRLAAYEDAEEQGLLVILPCKVGDKVWFYLYENRYYLRKGIYRGTITELKSVQRLNQSPLVLAVVEYEYPDPWYGGEMKRSEMHCSFSAYGSWVRFYLTREEAEAAMKGE